MNGEDCGGAVVEGAIVAVCLAEEGDENGMGLRVLEVSVAWHCILQQKMRRRRRIPNVRLVGVELDGGMRHYRHSSPVALWVAEGDCGIDWNRRKACWWMN